MRRRTFTRTLTLGAAGLALSASRATPARLRRPERLRRGDAVGLITPASFISDDSLQKAVTNLESLGLKVVMGQHLRDRYGSLAGTDAQRLSDLHQFFADPKIKGIWCARGGYGTPRLLEQIDYRLVKLNPKVFIGYSDITALLNAFWERSQLVSFHGPVGASTFTDYTREQVQRTLFEPSHPLVIAPPAVQLDEAQTDSAYEPQTIRGGTATGPLVGGNLSLLASSVGTTYAPDVRGKLLFIEDIGEKPYRIDRMLTTLRQAWPLEKAAGIVLGIFNDCEAKAGTFSLTLQQTLRDRLGDLPIPIAYGLPIGHIDNMCTLPVGVPARLAADDLQLTILESGVK
ncbi:MAG: LD-carboxypeptidase [Bacteroidota bacterium]